MTNNDTDAGKPTKDRDWLDGSSPPMGHNNPPESGPGIMVAQNAEDVAALVARHMGHIHSIARHYKSSVARQTDDGLRAAAVQALGAYMELLAHLGGDGDHLAIPQRLFVDLKEVAAGRHIGWLEPSGDPRGVAGVPEDVAFLRAGYAAAVAELSGGARGGIKQAAQYVEKHIPANSRAFDGERRAGPRSAEKKPRWYRVRQWYYDCEGASGDAGMRDLYRQMLAREKERPGTLLAFLRHPHDSFLRHPSD